MAEYIDKEAFKKSVEEHYCNKLCKAEGKDHNGCKCRACWVDDMLDEVDCFQPAADVAPVVHGHWDTGYFHDRVCSCCLHPDNDINDYAHSYCPNCGAKMDGPVGNSDRLEEAKV